jgi:hypothetical protein
VADIAIPKDKCRIGLDHLEGVLASAWFRHGETSLVSWYRQKLGGSLTETGRFYICLYGQH